MSLLRLFILRNAVSKANSSRYTIDYSVNRYFSVEIKQSIKIASNEVFSSASADTTTGQKFNTFLLQSKGPKSLINLNDLSIMLSICNEPKHINYVLHSIRVFQEKGKDFNEMVASHFIRASLRCDGAMKAAEVISEYKNRVGAWVTPKTLHLLIEKLISLNEITLTVKMLSTISRKGVIASSESFYLLFESMDKSDKDLVDKAVSTALAMLKLEESNKLLSHFQLENKFVDNNT